MIVIYFGCCTILNAQDISYTVNPLTLEICFGVDWTNIEVVIQEGDVGNFTETGSNVSHLVRLVAPTSYKFEINGSSVTYLENKDISGMESLYYEQDEVSSGGTVVDSARIECTFKVNGEDANDIITISGLTVAPYESHNGGEANKISAYIKLHGSNYVRITPSHSNSFSMNTPTVTLDVADMDTTMYCEYEDKINFNVVIEESDESCTYGSISLMGTNISPSVDDEILEVYKSGSIKGNYSYLISTDKINRNYDSVYAVLSNNTFSVRSESLAIDSSNDPTSEAPIKLYTFNRQRKFSAEEFNIQADLSEIFLMGLLEGTSDSSGYDLYDVDGYSGATPESLHTDEFNSELYLYEGYYENDPPFRFENKSGYIQDLMVDSLFYAEYKYWEWTYETRWYIAAEAFLDNAYLTISGSDWLSFTDDENVVYYRETEVFGDSASNWTHKRCPSIDSTIINLLPEDINIASSLCAADNDIIEIRVSEVIDANYTPSGTAFSAFKISGIVQTAVRREEDVASYYEIIPSKLYGESTSDIVYVEFQSIGKYDVIEEIILYSKFVPIKATRSDPSLLYIDEALCYDSDPIRLYSNYDIDSVAGNGTSELYTDWYFSPAEAYDSSYLALVSLDSSFRYYFTDDRGCSGDTAFEYTIYASPQPVFMGSELCLDTLPMLFSSESSLAGGGDSILHYTWNFGDGTTYNSNWYSNDTIFSTFNNGKTSGTKQNPKHKYTDAMNYDVSLQLTSEKGCIGEISETILVDGIPEPNFIYAHQGAIQDTVYFTNTSNISSIVTSSIYSWDFGDEQSYEDDSVGENVAVRYASHGIYPVQLTATTINGCTDSIEIPVPVFPYVSVQNGGVQTYNFSQEDGWYSSKDFDRSIPANKGWSLREAGDLAGENINDSDSIWHTGSEDSEVFNEDSWVESPCFDISELDFPMVRMDIYQSVQEGSDGAVLQYTVNDGQDWIIVGEYGSGECWYNKENISSAPGDQEADNDGWSAYLNEWQNARYSIEEVRNVAKDIGAICVRFRMAYASNSDNGGQTGYQGFAFDNFEIGARKRIVLIEEFLNSEYDCGRVSDTAALNEFVKKYENEVFDIRYHMNNYQMEDPLHFINPWDNSARSFEYGCSMIGQSSIIDGIIVSEPLDYEGYVAAFESRALNIPPYEIYGVELSKSGNSMNISGNVKRLSNNYTTTYSDEQHLLRVGVIQEEYTAPDNTRGKNVLIDLLPNGMINVIDRYSVYDPVDTEYNFDTYWTPAVKTQDQSFKLVIYIQGQWGIDEVMAVWYSDSIAEHVPLTTTDINEVSVNTNYTLYPNPITEVLHVGLAEGVNKEITWKLYGVSGNLMKSGINDAKASKLAISVDELMKGMYIFEITEPSGNRISHKILKVAD